MNNSDIIAFTNIEAITLAEGKSKRVICPVCDAKHEASFQIRKSDLGDVTGYCFRASCPIHGKVFGMTQTNAYVPADSSVSSFKPRFYERQNKRAPVGLRMWLYKNYNIPLSKGIAEGLGYDEEYIRMVWPVYDRFGVKFGHMTKALPRSNPNYPKWVTYFERETNKLHYPRANMWTKASSEIVAVEDIISAVRVSQMTPAVALLGTHMTQGMVNELRDQYKHLIIALDPDATELAHKMKQKYGSFFKHGITVRPMQIDPKDFDTDLELIEQLGIKTWTT